ncbi:D-Ala-D-Ala carboxypeptidase family metallohydrolase [Alistipes sp.]|uniref:D-Ala-D-Ala carboxypeptidase family metallohydrolase n=1 Tax=Alistipes sp. TaxID=1872444 RepID=UPI003AEFE5DA
MQYFTIQELTASSTARTRGIDNTPNAQVQAKLTKLIDAVLDPVRRIWGRPITVNSGYRCPALNVAVRGAANSQHLTGEAADITTGTREGNRELFEKISRSGVPFDQLIDESGYSWIHISYSGRNRRQVLHL